MLHWTVDYILTSTDKFSECQYPAGHHCTCPYSQRQLKMDLWCAVRSCVRAFGPGGSCWLKYVINRCTSRRGFTLLRTHYAQYALPMEGLFPWCARISTGMQWRLFVSCIITRSETCMQLINWIPLPPPPPPPHLSLLSFVPSWHIWNNIPYPGDICTFF